MQQAQGPSLLGQRRRTMHKETSAVLCFQQPQSLGAGVSAVINAGAVLHHQYPASHLLASLPCALAMRLQNRLRLHPRIAEEPLCRLLIGGARAGFLEGALRILT
jgi:hypothetical protein